MTIEQTTDMDQIDRLYRLPEVYGPQRQTGGPEPEVATLSTFLATGAIFLLVRVLGNAVGFFMFLPLGMGAWEVHTNMSNDCRGKNALAASVLGQDWMFMRTDCQRLVSYCPDAIPESLAFANASGFRQDFGLQTGFSQAGQPTECKYVSIDIYEWLRSASQRMQWKGQWFVDEIAKVNRDKKPVDAGFLGVLGACLYIALECGQPEKAELLYNQLAAQARIKPIQFYGYRTGGVVWSIEDCVVLMDNRNKFVVLKDW